MRLITKQQAAQMDIETLKENITKHSKKLDRMNHSAKHIYKKVVDPLLPQYDLYDLIEIEEDIQEIYTSRDNLFEAMANILNIKQINN